MLVLDASWYGILVSCSGVTSNCSPVVRTATLLLLALGTVVGAMEVASELETQSAPVTSDQAGAFLA
jgi:hypothetical protein